MNCGVSRDTLRLAYNGEAREYGSDCYVLGGRVYSAAGRRFHQPDRSSPFDEGGVNRYAYCGSDPINHVDPTGDAWWEWVLAGIGLAAATAATFASGGALASALSGPATMLATLATSSGATAVAAATIDIISVAAEIGAMVSLGVGDERSQMIFGWLAFGTGVVSAGTARMASRMASAPRRGSAGITFGPPSAVPGGARSQRLHEALPPLDEIADVAPANHARGARSNTGYEASASGIDASRFDTRLYDSLDSTVRLRTKLYRIAGGSYATHYATDMPTTLSDQRMMLLRVATEHPTGDVFFYGGKHGAATGLNWQARGTQIFRVNDVSDDILARQKRMFNELNASTLNGRGTFDILSDSGSASQLFKRPGCHIHPECYGAIDELLALTFSYVPPSAIARHLHVI